MESVIPMPSQEQPEQLPEPLSARTPINLLEMEKTHEMLMGFRGAVKEGSFPGRSAEHIAMGIIFLTNMLNQSSAQIKMAKQSEQKAPNA